MAWQILFRRDALTLPSVWVRYVPGDSSVHVHVHGTRYTYMVWYMYMVHVLHVPWEHENSFELLSEKKSLLVKMLFPSFFILTQAYSSIKKRMVIISTQSHKKNISFLYISLFQELASGNCNQPSAVWAAGPKMDMVLLQPRQEAGDLGGPSGWL